MTSLTEKAEDIIKDPHFMHSAGIGLSAMLLVRYMNKNQPEAPPAQIVQLASKPRNTQLIVAVGATVLAYYYMNQFGHSFPPEKKSS